jgi:hypothetical protein
MATIDEITDWIMTNEIDAGDIPDGTLIVRITPYLLRSAARTAIDDERLNGCIVTGWTSYEAEVVVLSLKRELNG